MRDIADRPDQTPAVTARRLVGSASLNGLGLVTGCRSEVRLKPGPPGAGVLFRRIDRRGRGAVVAPHWRHVGRPGRTTCLVADNGAKFHQVEHMLSALAAAGVRDAIVEVDNRELPHLDGSASPYCDLILEAGLAPAAAPRAIVVQEPFEHRIGDTWYRFEPAPRLELDINIELMHFGALRWQGAIDWQEYVETIAPARSWHRLHPIKTPILALGWLRNRCRLGILVIWRDKALNLDGIRMPDEMVRHRVIDVLGDLTLAGAPLVGRVATFSPAHAKTRAAIAALMASPTAWRMEEVAEAPV